jgi:chloramphenicol O-acetyltransferase type A
VTDDFQQFRQDYETLTGRVLETAQPHDLSEGAMVIGTSVLADHEIDGAVNIYAGIYNNPFLIWGKYRRGWFKTTLPMSFQFHHTQMDGIPAAEFLVDLQREIDQVK